ncbi:MAG: hypothetical protein LQ338_007024 [Usnochroma carphineum]|nr:MAG: hypothetical protein LQ338_007024 [Usnochroma carphineum]
MRLRLGLLQDHAAIDRQIAREAAEAQAKRQKQEVSTVMTEAQAKAGGTSIAAEKVKGTEKAKTPPKPKIRPLSEAKAIDAGANFASETFLLTVGIGLIVFERWWASRRETTRREDVSDRITELEESEKSARRALVELEKEILRLRAKAGEDKSSKRILPKEVWEVEEKEEEELKAKSNEITLTTHDIALPVQDAASTVGLQRQRQQQQQQQQQQPSEPRHQLFLLLTPVSILGSERHTILSRIERFATLTTDPKPAIAFLLANNSIQSTAINGLHTYLTLQIIDICHSIRDVAAITESERGMKVLEDYLGEEDAKNIESFWAEEWICD